MPKRFTDTDKGKRPWFRSLPIEYKMLWIHICDHCDCAGFWYVDMDLASFMIGATVEAQRGAELLEKQIEVMEGGSVWFIRDFIEFQYGVPIEELNPSSTVHRGIIRLLEKHGITTTRKALPKPSKRSKDQVQVKDKAQVQDTTSNLIKNTMGTTSGNGARPANGSRSPYQQFMDGVLRDYYGKDPGDPDPAAKAAVTQAYKRFGRAGSYIMTAARQNPAAARACVDAVVKRMQKWDKPCQLDTVARWADEYFANPEGFNRETERIRR